MSSASSKSTPRTRLGCGYLAFTVVITCVLLTINGMIVTTAYYTATVSLPPGSVNPRLGQAVVLLGPVVLLFIEWWIFDVATDWLRPRRPADGG